jgi:hypothetical protein
MMMNKRVRVRIYISSVFCGNSGNNDNGFDFVKELSITIYCVAATKARNIGNRAPAHPPLL